MHVYLATGADPQPVYQATLTPRVRAVIRYLSADNVWYDMTASGDPPALARPQSFRLTRRKPKAIWHLSGTNGLCP